MYKAFQGPNGWYVAWEEDGWHHQPAQPAQMERAAAERLAAERNQEEEEN